MNIRKITTLFFDLVLAFGIAITALPTQAAVPQTLNYQGQLANAAGVPVNATVSMTFKLYDVDTGGTALWTEAQSVVVSNGLFSVVLGKTTPLAPGLFGASLYLGITVASDGEMTPRQPLTSVGNAFVAQSVAPGAVTAASIGASCAEGQFLTYKNGAWVCGSVSLAPNAVGICTQGGSCALTCNAGWANCDGNSANGCEVNAPGCDYAVGVTVSGLNGTGLVLQNNGGNDIAINANGVAAFAPVITTDSYNVTVLNAPAGQGCTVSNGTGSLPSVGVNVAVTCADIPVPVACDSGLAIDSNSATEAAAAMGLCSGSGFVSAEWVLPNGSAATGMTNFDIGHGILNSFGPNVIPQEGQALLALSTGTARQPTDAGYDATAGGFSKGYTNTLPAGFPTTTINCPNATTFHDGIALKVTVTAPVWASSFQFDWKFYGGEYPTYVCSQFADQAIVRVSPIGAGIPANGNIMFDAVAIPPSVNSMGTIQACKSESTPLGTYSCPLGTSQLAGTGYENNGASGWQISQAPVVGGSTLTLYFTIWDSGDGLGNSTILFDNWRWLP